MLTPEEIHELQSAEDLMVNDYHEGEIQIPWDFAEQGESTIKR